MNNPFWTAMMGGITDKMEELGMDPDTQLVTVDANSDQATMNNYVNDLIVQEVDAIILAPMDTTAVTEALTACEEAGIPVINVDTPVDASDKVAAIIASDNYKAGWPCGEHVLETLDSAKILVLSHPEIKCTIDRLQGFKDALEGHEGYEIISEQPCSGLYDKGMTIMDNWLQQYTDFNVVFAINDGSLQGAIASMQAANRLEGVQSYAIDGQQQMADYILFHGQGRCGTAHQALQRRAL